jgi:hypothetical protein
MMKCQAAVGNDYSYLFIRVYLCHPWFEFFFYPM